MSVTFALFSVGPLLFHCYFFLNNPHTIHTPPSKCPSKEFSTTGLQASFSLCSTSRPSSLALLCLGGELKVKVEILAPTSADQKILPCHTFCKVAPSHVHMRAPTQVLTVIRMQRSSWARIKWSLEHSQVSTNAGKRHAARFNAS